MGVETIRCSWSAYQRQYRHLTSEPVAFQIWNEAGVQEFYSWLDAQVNDFDLMCIFELTARIISIGLSPKK